MFQYIKSWGFLNHHWREMEKLRSKPTNLKQAWLNPQPSRNSWEDSREFNKVSLVTQIIGYKPRINNKNNAKCMDKYLREALESDLVITKSRKVKDYLPLDTPLLDYLVRDTEGPTGWKYPKLQELRRFQKKWGLTYSVLDEVEVLEILLNAAVGAFSSLATCSNTT